MGDEGTGAGVRGVSGGERKRVTVGVGLVTQPQVLMLDEPTSGLDSETAVAIIELMQDLARQVPVLPQTCPTLLEPPMSFVKGLARDSTFCFHAHLGLDAAQSSTSPCMLQLHTGGAVPCQTASALENQSWFLESNRDGADCNC